MDLLNQISRIDRLGDRCSRWSMRHVSWILLCVFPMLEECVIFGIPEIRDHLYRKWQRDGCLRLAAQPHVTLCYGWAVGQSQCSRDRALTWLALDKRWQGRKSEISSAPHRCSYIEWFSTFLLPLHFSVAHTRHIFWLTCSKLITTNAPRLIHALNRVFFTYFFFLLLWIREQWIGGGVGGRHEWRQQRGRICPLRSVWMYTSSPGEASLGASRLLNTPIFGICRGWTGD